jgi:putative phosphoesterase
VTARVRIGVISDTHGLLRPQAAEVLRGSDLILHAGDIGGPEILTALAEIAPLHAVRGNNDHWTSGRRDVPMDHVVEVGGIMIYMRHILEDLEIDPRAAGFAAVVTGHSHRPHQQHKDGVLYFNPGSAGPRRFTLPIALGILTVSDGSVHGELIELTAA